MPYYSLVERTPTMTRPIIADPQTIEEWHSLPQEFKEYLECIDAACAELAKKEPIDSYDYTWEVDDKIPFNTILYYWNTPGELETPHKVAEDIQEGLCEAEVEAWAISRYS